MSILDDIPLPVGTEFWDKTVIGWDAEAQKYHVASSDATKAKYFPRWLSRELVEGQHGEFLMRGVEARTAKPGNAYNTRYFRSKT